MSYNPEEIAIKVSHVKKAYKIFDTPGQRFMYHMFHTKSGRDFVALDDVSFEIKKGEAFGIIGRNGSGKSTMLQILAGIIKATEGDITVNGRVAALLELGSGFNPESTGYENIYMNAAILGVTKERIEEKISEIIEFADIGDFINQPVKTYSSGMFVRLAFSVAINVDADILLIDEALAVGDVFFRQKCYTKLNKLKKEGKTIVLVSHGMNEVEQFCDRALLLDKSKVYMCGDSREVVQNYYVVAQEAEEKARKSKQKEKKTSETSGEKSVMPEEKKAFRLLGGAVPEKFNCVVDSSKHINSGKVEILNIGIFDGEGEAKKVFHQGDYAFFVYEIKILKPIKVPICGIVFYDQKNTIIFGKDNLQTEVEVPEEVEPGTVLRMCFKIKLDIAVGEYTFDAGVNCMDMDDYKHRSLRNQEEVNETKEILCIVPHAGEFAVHARVVGEPMQIMFHGCCDLPNQIELNL